MYFFRLKIVGTYANEILSALFEGGEGRGESKIFARFLAPVQEASIAAEELFRLSEFCTCLTDLGIAVLNLSPYFLTPG